MGYEISYKYYEKNEDGYNREESKILKKRVGDPFEDVSLERLAAAIMTQYARRDIFVTDVEVYELSKNKISFRETKGGIVVKNKKFLFDGENNIVEQELVDAPQAPSQQVYQNPIAHHVSIAGSATQPQPVIAHSNLPPHNQGQLRAVRQVVFMPELQMMTEVRQKGLRFTPDKKYPVYQVQPSPTGLGEIYKMVDDTGREQLVSDKYFVPGEINLIADRELGFSENSQQRDGGKLYWGTASNEPNMPDIRGRR